VCGRNGKPGNGMDGNITAMICLLCRNLRRLTKQVKSNKGKKRGYSGGILTEPGGNRTHDPRIKRTTLGLAKKPEIQLIFEILA
jgi:hypothetical protein